MTAAIRLCRELFRWCFFPFMLIFNVWFMTKAFDGMLSPRLATSILFFGSLALLTALERWCPAEPRWSKRDEADTKVDAASLVLVLLVGTPVTKALTTLLAAQMFLLLGKPHEFSLFPKSLGYWGEFVLMFLISDCSSYWMHRFSHKASGLMRIHAAHHSARRLYSLNGYRIHLLNASWAQLATFLPFYLLGSSPKAVAMFASFSAMFGLLQHNNVNLKYGFLNYCFSTPEVHRWHHSVRPEEGNNNFSVILMVWDHLFGTFYFRKDAKPERLGLFEERSYPRNSYLRQLVVPLFWKKWVVVEGRDGRAI